MPELLFICPAIIVMAGMVAPLLCKLLGDRAGYVLSVAPFAAFALLISLAGTVSSGSGLYYSVEWFGSLGGAIDMRLDGLAFLMAVLITGIGGFIVLYAQGYMHGHPQLGRFYLYLLSFMAAMLGLVLANNLILLFIFWELTSITSYLLIGFNHESKEARWKALQALLVTGLGAMAMLAGFILLAEVTGTWKISEINNLRDLVQSSPGYTGIVILVLIGAFTKSAQVPFHFWLPNAMAGPTPVSAFLHSATMVKAGVFLMALLTPSLGGTPLWGNILSIFGGATLLLAVFLGLYQKDVKYVLAYTTLSVLGLLTMLLGIGSHYAIKAMVVFLLGHALYKATLFMVAGSIDHEAGTRDATLLRGLRGLMPITAIAGGLAALSMSGLPPFFGFIGKELVYKAGVSLSGWEVGLLVAAFAGNFLMMCLALNVGVGPFWGKPNHEALPKKPHEAPFSMWVGPLVLAGAGLVFGIFPFLITGSMVAPAVAAIEGTDATGLKELHLELWHLVKPSLPLLISAITIAAGIVCYLARRKFWALSDVVLPRIRPFGAEAMYERIFHATMWLSKVQTRRLQTGRLHDYVFIIVIVTTGLLAWAISSYSGWSLSVDWASFDLLMVGITIIMAVAAVLAVVAHSYMTVLVALGTVGFGVALIFAYFGAPDLAITQLLVETLTVVLFMFVILKLPKLQNLSGKATRVRDMLLASTFGALITILLLKALYLQFDEPISGQLAEMSYPEAKGKNVVNVILVDFRALDTMGEIVVVATAALGIAALVSSGLKKTKEGPKS